MAKHFLSILDLSVRDLVRILGLAIRLKRERKRGYFRKSLRNSVLSMVFEKPSLRTRVSFETGFFELGGHAIYLGPSDIQMGKRESVADVVRNLGRMSGLIMARVFEHATLEEMAKHSTVPVINALSEREHPCQTLADLLTMKEKKGSLRGLRVAFVGDGENNVTHSLALAAGRLGLELRVASPKGYEMLDEVNRKARKLAEGSGGEIWETDDPATAVADVDVVYTDTWISMGDEAAKKKRIKDFKGFTVTAELMKRARKDAIFMHDLPAYRGNEVTDEIIESKQSVVFDQAENRLHTQKALMLFLLGRM